VSCVLIGGLRIDVYRKTVAQGEVGTEVEGLRLASSFSAGGLTVVPIVRQKPMDVGQDVTTLAEAQKAAAPMAAGEAGIALKRALDARRGRSGQDMAVTQIEDQAGASLPLHGSYGFDGGK